MKVLQDNSIELFADFPHRKKNKKLRKKAFINTVFDKLRGFGIRAHTIQREAATPTSRTGCKSSLIITIQSAGYKTTRLPGTELNLFRCRYLKIENTI